MVVVVFSLLPFFQLLHVLSLLSLHLVVFVGIGVSHSGVDGDGSSLHFWFLPLLCLCWW